MTELYIKAKPEGEKHPVTKASAIESPRAARVRIIIVRMKKVGLGVFSIISSPSAFVTVKILILRLDAFYIRFFTKH